jgi:hypothetical protein
MNAQKQQTPRGVCCFLNVPMQIRTAGLSLRRRTLYPAELWRQTVIIIPQVEDKIKLKEREKRCIL